MKVLGIFGVLPIFLAASSSATSDSTFESAILGDDYGMFNWLEMRNA